MNTNADVVHALQAAHQVLALAVTLPLQDVPNGAEVRRQLLRAQQEVDHGLVSLQGEPPAGTGERRSGDRRGSIPCPVIDWQASYQSLRGRYAMLQAAAFAVVHLQHDKDKCATALAALSDELIK